jgi:hypothetical protein
MYKQSQVYLVTAADHEISFVTGARVLQAGSLCNLGRDVWKRVRDQY